MALAASHAGWAASHADWAACHADWTACHADWAAMLHAVCYYEVVASVMDTSLYYINQCDHIYNTRPYILHAIFLF